MRTLIIAITILLVSPVYADGISKLRLDIANPIKTSNYFLCVANAGCFSIANTGKVFLMDSGKVSSLFAADIPRGRLYTQVIPHSCQVTVSNGQTLTITGKLKVKNSNVYVADLHCRVA